MVNKKPSRYNATSTFFSSSTGLECGEFMKHSKGRTYNLRGQRGRNLEDKISSGREDTRGVVASPLTLSPLSLSETSKEAEIREYIEERLRRKESVYIKRLTRALHVGYCRAQRVLDEYISAGDLVKSAGFGYTSPTWKTTKSPDIDLETTEVEVNGDAHSEEENEQSESVRENGHPVVERSPALPKQRKYPLRSAIKLEQLDDTSHARHNTTTTTTSSHSSSPSPSSHTPSIHPISFTSRKRKSARLNQPEHESSDDEEEASSSHYYSSINNNHTTTSSNSNGKSKRFQWMARAIAMKCNINATPLPPPVPKITVQYSILHPPATPTSATTTSTSTTNNNAVNTPPRQRGRPRIHFNNV